MGDRRRVGVRVDASIAQIHARKILIYVFLDQIVSYASSQDDYGVVPREVWEP